SSIQDLRVRLQEVHDNALAIRATAEAEKRDLTPQETRDLDSLLEEFDLIEGQIKRFERIEANHMALVAPQRRQTEPDNPADRAEDDPDGIQARSPAKPQANANGEDREPPARRDRLSVREVPIQDRYRGTDRGTWGWRAMGEFAQAVRRASMPGGFVDPRLDVRGQPASYGSEGTEADGGFAVPPDFRTAIREKMMGVESLLPR